jgi:CheY-like chemotaxis protein
MAMADLVAAMPADRSLLIVEDDKSFLQRLARAMESRGFTVTTAESVADGLTQLETISPAFAVVDMRLEDGNGLDVISALKRRRPDARAIILTGYGNIATAVNAVKLGAHPAYLRAVRPQRVGNRTPPQHAPPHAAAHFGQARAEVTANRKRRLSFHAVRPFRVGERGKAHRRCTRESEHHALAGRGMEPVLGRLAHDRCTEAVGNDETHLRRKNLARHIERGGEKQPIAMQPVFDPLLVGAKVRNGRFDLDDPHFAAGVERHQIGAPARRQR